MANTVETVVYKDCADWFQELVLAARSDCDVVMSSSPVRRSFTFDVVREGVVIHSHEVGLTRLREPIFHSVLEISGVNKTFLDLILEKVSAQDMKPAILQFAETLSSYGQRTEARSELAAKLATPAMVSWAAECYGPITDERIDAMLPKLGWVTTPQA